MSRVEPSVWVKGGCGRLCGWVVDQSTESGHFLVVEDDALLAGVVARELGRRHRVSIAGTVREAKEAERRFAQLSGAIIDVRLPDGSGFDVLHSLRRNWPMLPVLVMTGALDREVVNQSQQLGVEFVAKPAMRENLLAFVARAMMVRQRSGRELVHELSGASELSDRERQVLELALEGATRVEIAERLGVSENTLKAQVRKVLRKCGHANLAELVQTALREAWASKRSDN